MVRISNPIEQLIHNVEHERAKVYWETVKRFKVQEEPQRKAGQAHERRQLEYMRSAGLKLNEVEKGLEEDARKLKSYFEQKRPPLISRPKQAVLFPGNLGAYFIPPYGTPVWCRPWIHRKSRSRTKCMAVAWVGGPSRVRLFPL
jgi:hypothetical protein